MGTDLVYMSICGFEVNYWNFPTWYWDSNGRLAFCEYVL